MSKKYKKHRYVKTKNSISVSQKDFRANFYEGGKFTQANRDFYNATQEFENTASIDRDTLRARARWLHENNPIIANIDRTISANVVGGGIKFQFKMGDEANNKNSEALNKEVEAKWEYAKESLDVTSRDHFDEMCRVALKSRFMDGEILAYMPILKDDGEVRLALQFIEADRFALGKFNTANGLFYDGIETNFYGKPIFYHLSNNLFDSAKIIKNEIKSDTKISAKDMLYYYKRDNRPTQYRGISEYKQTITDLKNFAAQMRATIEAARSRANIAYTLTKNPIPTGDRFKRDIDGNPIETINGIFVQYLNEGEKIEVLDPKIADDNFDAFVRTVVRLIAAGRSVSYELAFRDYAQVNYSSGRMSWLQDYKLFDEEFLHFTRNFYKPIFMRWFELEALKGSFRHLSYEEFLRNKAHIATNAIKLYPPKREWVDPLKESKAIETELICNTTTLESVYAKRGLDWEEELNQIARERERMIELKLLPNGVYDRDSGNKILEREQDDE